MPELLIALETNVLYKSQNEQQQAAVAMSLVVPQSGTSQSEKGDEIFWPLC